MTLYKTTILQTYTLVSATEKSFHKVKRNSKWVVQTYSTAMKTRPYLTNSINACALGLIGDVMCQKLVEKQDMDWARTARFVFFCTYYQVNMYHTRTIITRS